MEVHERRFLTANDRQYLDEVELTLARVYRIPPERAGTVARALGRDLQRMRARGDQTPPGVQFPYGGAAGHAEALAALIVAPQPPSLVFLGLLALMGAAAGLLGMRVLLALVFRDFAPVHIGWLDIALAGVVVGVILGAAQSAWLPKRLGRINLELRRFGGHSMICICANPRRCPDAESSCTLSPRLQGRGRPPRPQW